MSSFLQTSQDPDDRLGIWGGLTQAGRRSSKDESRQLSQPNAEHFTAHWARAQLPVRAFLTGYLSDRSSIDDCIQEVALLAWKKGPRGTEDGDRFVAFCLGCARRIAMAEVRKKYRNRVHPLSEETAALLAETVARKEQEEMAESAARISALQACLDGLDPAPRRLLELRYSTRDLTALQKEAVATGKSMDAIYKKLERLRALLRNCVARKFSISE